MLKPRWLVEVSKGIRPPGIFTGENPGKSSLSPRRRLLTDSLDF